MKAKTNGWMGLVALAIIGVSIGWVVSLRHKEEPKNTEAAVAVQRPAAEQAFLDAVLESPEQLDNSIAVTSVETRNSEPSLAVPACTLPTGKERHLLSDIEKPAAPQPLKEPVAIESLHFWADYASLRTDAVRNPGSAENRAGVVSLMKARQRRLGQVD